MYTFQEKNNGTGLANKLKFNDCFFSSKLFNDLTESIIHFHQSLVREEYLSKL